MIRGEDVHLLVDGELDGVCSSACAQVVHAGLEARLPRVEVQRCELAEVDVAHVHVERLALVDECATVCSHVHQDALFDLPHCLVQRLQLDGDVQILEERRGTLSIRDIGTEGACPRPPQGVRACIFGKNGDNMSIWLRQG